MSARKGAAHRRGPAYTPEERRARWTKLAGYIRRTRTLKDAIALARTERVTAPTAAWLTALSKMLDGTA